MVTLVFFRRDDGEESFYPLDMPYVPGKTIEGVARDNAECNPGTVKVEDIRGRVLWRVQLH